ncbi:MAG TPA: glycosyltransferase 87 family protein [Methylomirabilota bacterium]|jgi:hypothetical protein|nr:glycosyltransferase 87 family protein [Methylomirabilota bacterium]
MTAPDVTAVVVSWNTREHLARCLAALEAAAGGLRVETIVVDNGSTDGSQAMVADKFPRVRLIQSPDNVGFGRACNLGAAAGTGRAILLVNSDCEPAPGALATLSAALDADATLGAAFARLLNADGTLQPSVHDALPGPWSQAGDVVFASSLRYALYRAPGLKRALLGRTLRRHAAAHDVAWGGAACVLVRRKAFEAVDGFDPRFFMYMEDLDLCARLGAAGFRLRYLPEAVAVHHWGASTAKSPAPMLRHAYLSRLAYFDKHFPGWGGAVAGALISLELAVRTATLGVAARLTGSSGLRARADASAATRGAVAAVPRARVVAGVALALIVSLVLLRYAGDVARIAADSPFVDFAHYYVYTTLVARGGDPFDAGAIARLDAELGLRRAGAPGNYPPLFYVLMQPWTWLPFRTAAVGWLALGQALLAATGALVLARRPADPWRLAALLVLVAGYQPLVEDLVLGQSNTLVLFALTLGWWAARGGRPWLAGLALGALVHVKPQYALVIAALGVMGHMGLALRAAAVAAAGLAVSVAVLGPAQHLAYVSYVFPLPAHYHAWSHNHSVHGALHRLLDGALGARAVEILVPAVALAIVVAVARALRRAPAAEAPAFDWAFGLAVAAVPLLSPLTEEHHFVALLLPLALLVLASEDGARGHALLVTAALLLAVRYSLERFPGLHTGVLSLLLTVKLAGAALLAWLCARRLREAAR